VQFLFDVNPTSRQTIQNMLKEFYCFNLITAGARFHQSGCMGCIGMGQAPATGTISLRTMPRGISKPIWNREMIRYICAVQKRQPPALTGKITDPRDLENLRMKYPKFENPEIEIINRYARGTTIRRWIRS
jgi:aconitate hydratase